MVHVEDDLGRRYPDARESEGLRCACGTVIPYGETKCSFCRDDDRYVSLVERWLEYADSVRDELD